MRAVADVIRILEFLENFGAGRPVRSGCAARKRRNDGSESAPDRLVEPIRARCRRPHRVAGETASKLSSGGFGVRRKRPTGERQQGERARVLQEPASFHGVFQDTRARRAKVIKDNGIKSGD